jgi:hypothetical protein
VDLDEIEVGQSYEVPGSLKEHHFPGYDDADKWRPSMYFHAGPTGPWTVTEKGVPYGKRQVKVGVRLQYTVYRKRPCEVCGTGWVQGEDGKPIYEPGLVIEAVVPATMIEGRWDQRLIRRDLQRLEMDEWSRERNPDRDDRFSGITPEGITDPPPMPDRYYE